MAKPLFLLNRKNRAFLAIACELASVIDKKIINFLFKKVKLPWAVHICEAKCTCGEATFLIE